MGEKSRMLMFCLLLGILVSPSHQVVTTLIPIELKKHWWRLWRTPITLAAQHSTLRCATTMCLRLNSQRKAAAKEVVGCVNTCIERCTMKN
ncbi:hypothetical protein J1N35_038881 [Gossypium stocksii]|uniref:Uncharacterized protein n=1 Tax=Gossypium stocksii TaxID=47602 RepID=A0A9D3UMS5_9ROSI|nr:hypothetical protein J1N35_038881 [Gossypium stocksii]